MKFMIIPEHVYQSARESMVATTPEMLDFVLENPKPQTFYCDLCGRSIYYQDCPTGGWWIHDIHFKDDHDAVCGGYGSDDDE